MNISLGRIHRKETQRRSAVASASRQANEPGKKSCQKHSTGSSALRFPADFISRHEFSILRENYMHINIYEIAVKIERTEEKS